MSEDNFIKYKLSPKKYDIIYYKNKTPQKFKLNLEDLPV